MLALVRCINTGKFGAARELGERKNNWMVYSEMKSLRVRVVSRSLESTVLQIAAAPVYCEYLTTGVSLNWNLIIVLEIYCVPMLHCFLILRNSFRIVVY